MQSFVLGRFLTAELWDPPFVRDRGADKSNAEDLDSFEFATHVFYLQEAYWPLDSLGQALKRR